jgi:hypothetical protein
MNLIARLFGAPSIVTIIRYALAALGGILVENGNFDPGQWDTLSGAVLVVVPLFLGVKATITPKVVADDGSTTKLKDMPPTTAAIANSQAKTVAKTKPNLFDKLGALFKR